MRKYLFALFAIAVVLVASAQYTITANSNPVVGDRYDYYFMDTTGVTFGGSGPSQWWDYSNLSISFFTRMTETYTTVASTPSASAFSAANIASETNGGYFRYYNFSAIDRSFLGDAYTNGNSKINSNPVPFFLLPFGYGSGTINNVSSVFTSTYTSTQYPTSYYSSVQTITAEGTGTLVLPNGIHTNVLKIKTVKADTLVGTPAVTTEVRCQWYSADSKFPLLDISVSVSTDGTTAPFVNKVVWMNDITDVGLPGSRDAKAAFSIHPNPSQTDLFVDFEAVSGIACSIDIVDRRGSVVKQEAFRSVQGGMQQKHIDLSALSAGTYFVKLRAGGKEGVRQLVIE